MIASTVEPLPIRKTTTLQEQQQRSVGFAPSTKQTSSSGKIRRRTLSDSVPIPDALLRSPSELQLSMDERVADERDFVFYARLVSGIQKRNSWYINAETERCLTHIMQTRHNAAQTTQTSQANHSSQMDYYLDNLECVTDSSEDSSVSSYQHDFETTMDCHELQDDDHDDDDSGDNECIFELEL